ncbi:hypothetical protein ACSBR2_026509 [Camellia fascicularis]
MERNDKKKSSDVSFFQMPLHYPKYTRKDYQNMPESVLDRVLAQYGLSSSLSSSTSAVQGADNLAYKRDFAMGAFLWPSPDSS